MSTIRQFISTRLDSVEPSATLEINKRAKELSKLHKIINLSVGEPDYNTPDNIKRAAHIAIDENFTKYTAVGGIEELKKAVVEKFKRDNVLNYNTSEVIVGVGAKQLIFNAIMATVDFGDEVIIPAPYWVSYKEIVMFAGGTPIIPYCSLEEGFKLTPQKLEEAITERTKWLILNSPSNPTGAVYTKEELLALGEVLEHKPWVNIMSDDIYEHIIYDDIKFYNIAQLNPNLKDRTLTINGVSKGYCMTGWRIGFAGGDKKLIKAMDTVQSHSTSCPSSISQKAALEALTGPQDFLAIQNTEFEQRRNIAVNLLKTIPGFKVSNPQGAFYIFINVSELINAAKSQNNSVTTCTDLAKFLLEEAKVALVPGSAFGAPGFLRISYAIHAKELEEAIEAIKTACTRV